MKIGIIGGGTAGFVAAAHLSVTYPQFDLVHIYDTSIPTIGVGEGTTPPFRYWLQAKTGRSFAELEASGSLTRKYGICFEGWGQRQPHFIHNFYPEAQQYAYHVDAAELVERLRPSVAAKHVDKKVTAVSNKGLSATISFADGTDLTADFVIDARGFPRQLNDDEHLRFDIIPTNSALVCHGPPQPDLQMTRSVTRPHGWIFVIPLRTRTSYGYVFNREITAVSDIENDFAEFLASEGVAYPTNQRQLNFPNFCRRLFFDGTIFYLGNAAAFLEPLEATAIGFSVKQTTLLSHWPLGRLATQKKREKLLDLRSLATFNNHMQRTMREFALFIGWHYAQGSPYDSPFWRFAQENWQTRYTNWPDENSRARFEQFLAAGQEAPRLAQEADVMQQTFERGDVPRFDMFSGWSAASFAEIGHGIGHYA
ncbi:MAG: tryptophan 7-halogenase [Chloroflexota bacterium]